MPAVFDLLGGWRPVPAPSLGTHADVEDFELLVESPDVASSPLYPFSVPGKPKGALKMPM